MIETEAYGPQIRGGESSCTVRVAAEEIFAMGDGVDVLVVFRWADFDRFRGEVCVSPDALVLYEATEERPGAERLDLDSGESLRWIPVPFDELSRASSGTPGSKNVVTLGILGELLGLPSETLKRALARRFGRKKASVLVANERAFDAGWKFAASRSELVAGTRLEYAPSAPRLLLSGNEAVAIGALHAGCRFFAGYPITPSSEILHFLAEWMPRAGGTVLQTEDELAAIGAVIGGSFAMKSMTATSGPGLSLMTEMLGLASMAEVPVVIVDVQRGGPSTGNPTKSEQSDLLQCMYGTHGDAPRVVLAGSDVEDCFHATVEAFNISEEFQVPVLLLSDQAVGQRKETISPGALVHAVRDRLTPTEDELEGYERYRDTPTGVSPMSIPGMKKGMYQTNGLEHDAEGRPSSNYLTHETMNAKRYRKMWPIRDRYHAFRRFGPARADVGVLCWGSTKGPVQEAVAAANARGERVAAFVPQMLYPFPKRDFEEFLSGVGDLLILELSYTAQFYKYLRTFLDLPAGRTHVLKRSGGKDLTAAEVTAGIQKARSLPAREAVAVWSTVAELPRFQPADYKSDLKPVWCAGCGDFGALASLHRAMAKLQLEPWNTVVVSGIGCSSRLPGYVETFGFNGVHGRALTLATGVKLARPELNVIAVGGDGDGIAIGGNHFLHAARRNLDIAYFMMDDEIYGLTKGQAAPTTPAGDKTKSTYWGNPEPSVDPCELDSFGATWVGRGFSGDPKTLVDLMTRAIAHRGFAFLNVMSPCVTWRGDDQFKLLKAKLAFLPADHEVTDRAAALRYTREKDVVTTGVLYEVRQPSLVERMDEVRRKALEIGRVAGTADILAAFAPPL